MAKKIIVNEDGTLTVIWNDDSVSTWRPDSDVDLTNYKELGAEVRRYAGF